MEELAERASKVRKSLRPVRLRHDSGQQGEMQKALRPMPEDVRKAFLHPDDASLGIVRRDDNITPAEPPAQPVPETVLPRKEKTEDILSTVWDAFKPRENKAGIVARKSLRRRALFRPFFKNSIEPRNKDILPKVTPQRQAGSTAEVLPPLAEALAPQRQVVIKSTQEVFEDVLPQVTLNEAERVDVEEVRQEESKALTQPVQELLSSLSREIPRAFRRQAARAAEYIARLDSNFDKAIKDENIRIFLSQLRSSGFVDRADRHSSGNEEIELPRWLNRKFLEEKGVLPELKQLAEGEVIDKDAVEDIENMLVPDMAGEPLTPKNFQHRIEGGELFTGLQEGRIKAALGELIALGIQPRSVKLFTPANSLVLFFNQRIEEFHRVNDVLEKYDIVGRGPAQDVYALEIGEKKFLREREMRRVIVASNDEALGKDGLPHYDYTQPHYTPEGFLRAYLEQLVLYGKNPAAPYETSFVYIRDSERVKGPLESSEITKFERRVYADGPIWYPVAYVGTGSLGLLGKNPEGFLKRLRRTISPKWQKSNKPI